MEFARILKYVIALSLLIFVMDLLLANGLDTNIINGRNQDIKVEYFVPYTGGGTSKCYPLTFSSLKSGQKVVIKRSLFLNVCIVMPRHRDAIDQKIHEHWFDRHPVED